MANIVKAQVLGDDEGTVDAAGRSTQLPEDSWDYGKTGTKEPPYNLDALAYFLEINTWHYRCVKAKTISTAGLGFDFVVPEEVKVADIIHKLVKLGVITINEGCHSIGRKPIEHPGAEVSFMMTSTGSLSLDMLAHGGIRPWWKPKDTGKVMIDSLLNLQDLVREELYERSVNA